MSPTDYCRQVVDEVTDKVMHRQATDTSEDEVRELAQLAENDVVSQLHDPERTSSDGGERGAVHPQPSSSTSNATGRSARTSPTRTCPPANSRPLRASVQ